MLRAVVFSLLAGVVLASALVIGVVALGVFLLVAPVALVVVGWLARHKLRRRAGERPAGPAVYEGEFRVLEETEK
jgi:hypothetical protein